MELALITPIMLLLLVGAIDVGRLFYTYVGVENAAREGAAFGMTNPTSTSGIRTAARNEMGGDTTLDVDSPTCTSAYGSGTAYESCPSLTDAVRGDVITVSVSYPFSFILPLIPSVTISSSATAAIQ